MRIGLRWSSPVNDRVVPAPVTELVRRAFPSNATVEPLIVLPTTQEVFEVTQAFQRLSTEAIHRPETLLALTPRQFEEFVAEIWERLGYSIELTAHTRDGGRDIIAVKDSELLLRILIECKRYTPPRPVDVSIVRALYGVKVHDQATKAIVATTSHFTADARKMLDAHPWELEGRDLSGVLKWVSLAGTPRTERQFQPGPPTAISGA